MSRATDQHQLADHHHQQLCPHHFRLGGPFHLDKEAMSMVASANCGISDAPMASVFAVATSTPGNISASARA